jgi:NAD(P)-dependent dehydrogenase (short-subunit alcohol dehydrogenase family)
MIPSFDIDGKVAVITGGAGILCASMSRCLAEAGVHVAILDIRPDYAETLAREIGGNARGFGCDVLDRISVEQTAEKVIEEFGRVDILINGAGGNKPQATTGPEQSFFGLSGEALRWVFDLNLMGTIITSQVFGEIMSRQKSGVILNISSMNAFRPLTRIPAYSAAKAGVSNFTQWLAVHMAQEYGPDIRVNGIAPGFFKTDQNRFLVTDKETGDLTPRGKAIIDHVPQGRFGVPEDLLGAVIWLLSPASSFVTGVVIPIDGGFSAYCGV